MAAATDAQMQAFADQRIRPRAEQFRDLVEEWTDDKASIDDVYARAVNGPSWADARTDGPAALATHGDILEYNALVTALLGWLSTQPNWPVVQRLCVRPSHR